MLNISRFNRVPKTCVWDKHDGNFITRTILGEQYKSFSSSLCNLLHSPVTSSLLGPNILLNTMFSNTLNFFPPAMSTTKFHTHTHTKQQAKFLDSKLEDKRFCTE